MRRVNLFLIVLLSSFSGAVGSARHAVSPALEGRRPEASTATRVDGSQLRVPFILNQGQVDRRVKFYAKTPHGTAYVTAVGEIVYDLPPANRAKGITGWSVKEELAGATIRSVSGVERAVTSVSYFVGKDPSQWQSDIPTYNVVLLPEVYNGIDLDLRAWGATVEKVFTVKPGASPNQIRVNVSGAVSLKEGNDGELKVETGLGTVVLTRPKAYQTFGPVTTEVDVAYAVDRTGYAFRVGAYDRTRPLVIDPMLQATYFGGNDIDRALAIATSDAGVYITGSTSSTDLPGTTGGASATNQGLGDAFVALLSSDLKTIIQATYFGGSAADDANAVAVLGSDVYIAGRTLSTDLPATAGAARPSNAGVADAFVARFSSDLQSLSRASYYGGFDEDSASSIVLMGTGAYGVFIGGLTASWDILGILNSAQPLKGDPNIFPVGQNKTDGFIAAFSSDLTQLTQATFLGGRESDQINALAAVPGFIYATGRTLSSDFPKTAGGYQEIRNPLNLSTSSDAFVAFLTSDLTTLGQSTYLGAEGQDIANAVAVSGSGVYVAGETGSSGFPGTLGGAYPTKAAGASDGFVALLNSGLTGLTQASFLGGTFIKRPLGVGVGSSFSGSVVYVVGHNTSASGDNNAFVSALSGNLKVPLADTVYGGTGSDIAFAIAIPPTLSGFHVFTAGSTGSTTFPNTSGGAQPSKSTGSDGFVAKLALVPDYSFSPIPDITLTPDSSGQTTVTVNSLNGFTGENVKLGIFAAPTGGPIPTGISVINFLEDIGPTPPNGSVQFDLTIAASAALTPSTYTLWLLGFPSTSVTHAAPVVVNVVQTFMGVQNMFATVDTAGCIVNNGVTRAFTRTLSAAESDASAGRGQNAVRTLNALIFQIESQRAKLLTATCTIDNVSVDPASLLIANVQGLITTVAQSIATNP